MTERARVAAVSEPGSAKNVLFELQVEQHLHDEAYHREIARLSLHQRLNHMALHFSKYVGKVAALETIGESIPVFVDTLVIALSTANILNVKLWDLIGAGDQEYPGLLAFGRAVAADKRLPTANVPAVVLAMATASGRMAAACEKIDHLESVSYRTEIGASVGSLTRIALAAISASGVDPAHAVRNRLDGVKKRSILHGRI